MAVMPSPSRMAPTRESLKEINQKAQGDGGKPRGVLVVSAGLQRSPEFPASGHSCPRPPCSREETRSPEAAWGRREPGTGWGRGGRGNGTQRKRRTLWGAPGMRAGFRRFLDRHPPHPAPRWMRLFCSWQGPPPPPQPTESQADGHTLPPSRRARDLGETGERPSPPVLPGPSHPTTGS